jgi:O-antigen ligase
LPFLANPRASRVGLGPLVLAAALPLLFLHRQYQPSFSTGGVTLTLADLGLAAVVVAALAAGLRGGFAPLRRTRAVWIALVLFVIWMFASLAWARHNDAGYAVGSHVVSSGKFFEFMLLAPAVPLILRRRDERRLFFGAFVLWSAFLTVIAILQFVGVVNEFEGRRPLQREPSYVGVHELGAISGAALSLALIAIVVGRRRRFSLLALLAGGLGVALAAALDSVGGMVAAAVTVWAVARARERVPLRRVIALAAVVVAVGIAAVSLRGSAVTAFLEFLGVRAQDQSTQTHVQTYAHRTLLGYIGVKIWLDHPIVGAGWQESAQPAAFTPHLAAAHRRFPTEPAEAFPARRHEWGVQNGIIQTLADLGVVGLVLLLTGLVAAFRLAVRAGSLVAPAWLWVAFAVFTGTGLLAGASVNVLLWLAVGLAVSVDRVPR